MKTLILSVVVAAAATSASADFTCTFNDAPSKFITIITDGPSDSYTTNFGLSGDVYDNYYNRYAGTSQWYFDLGTQKARLVKNRFDIATLTSQDEPDYGVGLTCK